VLLVQILEVEDLEELVELVEQIRVVEEELEQNHVIQEVLADQV
jgi:hypothetical protein